MTDNEKLNAIPIQELLQRMRYAINVLYPSNMDRGEMTKKFKEGNTYRIEVNEGKIDELVIYYDNYDKLKAVLNAQGFRMWFVPDVGMAKLLAEVNSLDDFLTISKGGANA
ncbi:MAG: hypothetical protein IKQ20_11855 [Bacteroidales bacterium]|nr:hypothetical protein [Bacteroidales bacterium]